MLHIYQTPGEDEPKGGIVCLYYPSTVVMEDLEVHRIRE
jgi:hypothetical protein